MLLVVVVVVDDSIGVFIVARVAHPFVALCMQVGNYNMEPPGLFRGRGKHPRMGQIKLRCMPEKVTINIGPGAKVPPCGVPGE